MHLVDECCVSPVWISTHSLLQVKENLLSCKMLLHCKRDELRKLWIEGIEHKHVLQLLDEIESIKQVPQRLEAYMASKHYLHATDMLVSRVMTRDVVVWQHLCMSELCSISVRWKWSRQRDKEKRNRLMDLVFGSCFVLFGVMVNQVKKVRKKKGLVFEDLGKLLDQYVHAYEAILWQYSVIFDDTHAYAPVSMKCCC